MSGKQSVLTELQRSRSDEVVELVVKTIVTHGYHGATEGFLKFTDGKTVAFCDVYQFRFSTRILFVKPFLPLPV